MERPILWPPVDARIPWRAGTSSARIRALYERAKRAQWNPSTDVDWSLEVGFGSSLPDDSSFGRAAFEASPLARYGPSAWDEFRWEFHSWLASQFAAGEQTAVVAAARLAEALPDPDARYFAATQVGDEARHADAFSRYVREKMPSSYPAAAPLSALLEDILADSRWDMITLGLQVILEGLAMAMLRLGDRTLHDPLIRRIMQLAARDEGRHVAFGIFALEGIYEDLTSSELAEREDLILEAAHLMREWFLLEDVWERIGLNPAEGKAFAETNEMMVAYRKAVFAKSASAVTRVDLMTDRVRAGLDRLNLIGTSAPRGL